MDTLFKFSESREVYVAILYAADGTQLVSITFEKAVIDRQTAFNIARNVFLDYY